MSKYYDKTEHSGTGIPRSPRKKNPWITVLKVICWCIGIIIVLAGIALWIISYKLSPPRITKLIEEKSAQYLKADVKIGRLDYKLFSTYPWLEFEIDSLSVVSRSLEGVNPEQKAQLPLNADSLASIKALKGKINVHGLLHDEIILKGIEISQPKINIVMFNDSITNYNIAPDISAPKKLPQFDISEVKVNTPININFFSFQEDTEAEMNVDDFYLAQGDDNNYSIGFKGFVNGRYQDFSLPDNIPLEFNTDISLNTPLTTIRLNNMKTALAGINLKSRGDISLSPKTIDIQDLSLIIGIEDVFNLLELLPEQFSDMLSLPEGLSGYLPIELTLSLIEPYHLNTKEINSLSLKDLPAFSSDIKIENGSLRFVPSGEKPILADDVFIYATGRYNSLESENSYFQIHELKMNGEGISIDGEVSVNNLFCGQQDFSGDFSFKTPLLRSLSYLLPDTGMKIAGLLKGKLEFQGKAVNLGKEGFKDLMISGDIYSSSLNINSYSTGDIMLKNLKSEYTALIPSYPLSDYSGTKFKFDLTTDSLFSKISDSKVILLDLNMKMKAEDTVAGNNPDPFGDLNVKIGHLSFNQGKTSFKAKKILMNANGKLNSGSNSQSYAGSSPILNRTDSIIESRIHHTPLELVYNGGGILQTFMNFLSLNAEISLGEGNFKTPSYLYPVDFSNLSLSSNLNKIQFTSSRISLDNTSFSIAGSLNGMEPFMTSYSATPISVSADIDFTNVDINRLSWGYYGALIKEGMNRDSVFYVPPMTPFTEADSICVVIPRNITADIRLHSNSAEYMQYNFSPLSTDIIVKNGIATLNKLTVGTPYCTAIVDWTYSTAQLDNIFMNLNARVKDFSFSPFYAIFPQLVKKATDLKDFTGIINANIGCNFEMYPDMFMNPASLKGNFDIKGKEMQFAREGKIERISHLMLIEGDQPIKIQNIDITGNFHDNILQINPFKIKFDDYQLEIAGVNNTSGDMYYHLALEKSPFHLPFGVSLFGKFKHPEVKLGGTHINDYKPEFVTMNPGYSNLNINIMAYLKHGWLLFVQEAAKYGEKENDN